MTDQPNGERESISDPLPDALFTDRELNLTQEQALRIAEKVMQVYSYRDHVLREAFPLMTDQPTAEAGKWLPDSWGHWMDKHKSHWWVYGRVGKFWAQLLDPETGMPDDEMTNHEIDECFRGGWTKAVPASELTALRERLTTLTKDTCETETAIRESIRRAGIDVDGDSHCVPGLVELVEELVGMLAGARASIAELEAERSETK